MTTDRPPDPHVHQLTDHPVRGITVRCGAEDRTLGEVTAWASDVTCPACNARAAGQGT